MSIQTHADHSNLRELSIPRDIWVIPDAEQNPWTAVVDWRLGFWLSRAKAKWPGWAGSDEPLMMATPAGIASPRILFFNKPVSSAEDVRLLRQILSKLQMKSALLLLPVGSKDQMGQLGIGAAGDPSGPSGQLKISGCWL